MIRPPRPNVAEGLGVRGNPIEWISTVGGNPALDGTLEPYRSNQPCARPPHPMKASKAFILFPRRGEGNRSRLSSSIEKEFRHCILRSSVSFNSGKIKANTIATGIRNPTENSATRKSPTFANKPKKTVPKAAAMRPML